MAINHIFVVSSKIAFKLKEKLLYVIVSLVFMSCADWVKIANLTVVSTRNYNSQAGYKELQRFAEGRDNGKSVTSREGKVSAENNGKITAAIEDAIRNVPGGECMQNVQVYEKNGKIKVVGDVWGFPENANKNQYGHNINAGEKVMFKWNGSFITGVVVAIEVDKAAVKYLDSRGGEQIKKFDYKDLTKYTGAELPVNSSKAEFTEGDLVTWKRDWGSEYDQGTVRAVKGKYVIVDYKNQNGRDKTIEIISSKLTKIQAPANNPTVTENNSPIVNQRPPDMPASQFNAEKQFYTVNTETLNVREEPNISSSSFLTLKKGSQVELVEKTSAGWWKVKYSGVEGYVSSKYLTK